ncbi:MAG: preprotein translocase subunit YajC [Gammaproteobacteria bacterium]|nr:preprotein translocase subunit YajC [Gammaproteobacteria bacterium]NND58937.1 preprotein translocase subunit YajC [Gammaproteobacteria bacterium]
MDLLISSAWAADAPPPGAGLGPLLMLGLFFIVFYFLLIRPQQKRAKEHAQMVTALGNGDEVVTAGGLLGKVTDSSDDFLSVEVADGVVVKVQRNTVARTLPKGTIKNA